MIDPKLLEEIERIRNNSKNYNIADPSELTAEALSQVESSNLTVENLNKHTKNNPSKSPGTEKSQPRPLSNNTADKNYCNIS